MNLSFKLISAAAFFQLMSQGLAAPSQAARPLVLMTTFEPFGGWSVNLSHEYATEIRNARLLESAGIDFEICRLPVVYDRAPEQAIQCLNQLASRPTLVLALGEGDCNIRVETAAANLDDTPGMPDNAGVIRIATPIISGAPDRLGFTLAADLLFCSADGEGRIDIVPSISTGNYVCNNNAFHLAHHLRPTGIPFGHLHVPHSGCAAAVRDIPENARILALMVEIAVDSAVHAPAIAQPVSLAEVDAALSSLPTGNSCKIGFLEKLRALY